MSDTTIFVGLDVHKKTIAVALAPLWPGAACSYYGTYEARWAAINALKELCPDLSENLIQPIVSVIIVIAARDHGDWFNNGVDGSLRDDRVK